MRRIALVFVALVLVVALPAWGGLYYSKYYGSPDENDIDEMASALEDAVEIINELESRIDDLERKVRDQGYRISNLE